MDSPIAPSTLYIVATPIGHLGDLSPRAKSVLASVSKIAAEDTRHSQTLLAYAGIKTPMVALHEHNEAQQSQALIEDLKDGASIAVISDAGTPGISDPGARLAAAAHAAGITVSTIPGPSALTAAVAASGLTDLPIQFHGFLPTKQKARLDALKDLVLARGTHVFYEAPHRIIDCLEDMVTTFPAKRELVLARELTKRFETIRRAPIATILEWVKSDPDQQKGEFVLVLQGASTEEVAEGTLGLGKVLAARLGEHLPLSEAARLAAQITGAKRGYLYEDLLQRHLESGD